MKDLGTLSQTLPKPFLEERFRNPKNFTEKGIPPNKRTEKILRCVGWGVCPSQGKFLGFLDPSSKKGLSRVWDGVPRSYPFNLAS